MRLAMIFVLALAIYHPIHLLHAQDAYGTKIPNELSFAEKMRPHLIQYLGDEWTVKLIGHAPVVIPQAFAMPTLPVINSDARSTAVYDKKADTIKLDPKVEQKFHYAYIKELYEVTRHARPTDEQLTQFMNVLTQGGARDGIYRSLVLDATYAGMENWDKPVKSATADFAVYFYGKYLGKKIQKKNFEGWSIYTLKRLITEKTLDMLAAFNDREQMESWYGILSADLALKFPTIWSNTLRKNSSPEAHKAWAAKVPIQHIKSEIIIKMHTAFNALM